MRRGDGDEIKFKEASRSLFQQHGVSVKPEALSQYFSPVAKAKRRSEVREFVGRTQTGPGVSTQVKADNQRRRLQLAELEGETIDTYPRSLEQLLNDGIFSFEFVQQHSKKRRMGAIFQVLSHLPGPDYKELLSTIGAKIFYFHLPGKELNGSVKNVSSNLIYIYLAQHLEECSHEFCRFVVAHELSHVFLKHLQAGIGTTDRIEQEADRQAAFWGYPRPSEF